MLHRIREAYASKASHENCKHPKAMTLSMIAIVSSSFFLYSQLAKVGGYLIGAASVFSLLVFFSLVDPYLNTILPIRRIDLFDRNPPLLFIFAAVITSLVLTVFVVGGFIHGAFGQMLLEKSLLTSLVLRQIVALFAIGIVLQSLWPYLREVDMSVEVGRVDGISE